MSWVESHTTESGTTFYNFVLADGTHQLSACEGYPPLDEWLKENANLPEVKETPEPEAE